MQQHVLDLLRHGEASGGWIFRGRTDSPLSDNGWRQMEAAVALQAPPWQAIVSSPLQRCLGFAERLAERWQLPLEVFPGMTEFDFGDWEGRAVEQVRGEMPEHVERFWRDPEQFPPPGGEAMDVFRARVLESWQILTARPEGHTLVITHGGVIRVLLGELFGAPYQRLAHLAVPHGCLSRVAIYRQPPHPPWPQLLSHGLRLPESC